MTIRFLTLLLIKPGTIFIDLIFLIVVIRKFIKLISNFVQIAKHIRKIYLTIQGVGEEETADCLPNNM